MTEEVPLGVIVPSVDAVAERWDPKIVPDGVSVHFARMLMADRGPYEIRGRAVHVRGWCRLTRDHPLEHVRPHRPIGQFVGSVQNLADKPSRLWWLPGGRIEGQEYLGLNPFQQLREDCRAERDAFRII